MQKHVATCSSIINHTRLIWKKKVCWLVCLRLYSKIEFHIIESIFVLLFVFKTGKTYRARCRTAPAQAMFVRGVLNILPILFSAYFGFHKKKVSCSFHKLTSRVLPDYFTLGCEERGPTTIYYIKNT